MRQPVQRRRPEPKAIITTASIALLSLASMVKAATSVDFASYTRNATLHENLDIYWTIDADLQTFRIAVHAKAASGWAGFGFSEMGGMEGSDIVFYEASTGQLTDAHALVVGAPVTDECSQDWTLLLGEVDADDGLVFEAERDLVTSDPQDRDFEDDSIEGSDPTKLIAAWGDDDVITYHGSDNVAQAQAYLFASAEDSNPDPLAEITSNTTVSYVDVVADKFTIPKIRTFYLDACLPASQMPGGGEFHAVGFDGITQPSTSAYVHHLVLSGFYNTFDCGGPCLSTTYSSGINPSSSSLSETSSSSLCNFTFSTIYTWTPGAPAFATPDEVGFRFGADSGFQSIGVQVHYNNPDGVEGMVDSSGVRVYYTEDFRPIDAGVMVLGDPFFLLTDRVLPDGKSKYSFSCPSSCSEEYFEQQSVTVFAHALHMHQAGQHMVTRQYRDDELVREVAVEYYAFEQAGIHFTNANESVTIQRGDRFETDCYYDTAFADTEALKSTNGSLLWGLGSEDEMCLDFVYYYPLQPIPNSGACGLDICGGALDEEVPLDIESDLNRTFGILQDATCDFLEVESGTDNAIDSGKDDGEQEASGTSSSIVSAPPLSIGVVIATSLAGISTAVLAFHA